MRHIISRRLMQIFPHYPAGVIFITKYRIAHNSGFSTCPPCTHFAARRAGARGYLLKDADKDEVVRAIVAVERGEAIFSPAIAKRMMKYFSAPSALSKKSQPSEFAGLTDRELEILDLIAQGHNNLVIANKLSLSIKTVQNYVSSILTKLQVVDRA